MTLTPLMPTTNVFLGTSPADPQPVQKQPDADFLERVAVVSFQKLILASGELLFPCHSILVDSQINLLQGVMESLGQRPPLPVLAEWRNLLAQKVAEGRGLGTQARIRVAFRPADNLLGLVGGFQVGISAQIHETLPPLAFPDPDDRGHDLLSQTLALGTLKMAAMPSLINQHLRQIRQLLEALGQQVSEDEVEGWRSAIAPILQQLFHQSPNAYLVVRYRVLDPAYGLPSGIALSISGEVTSVQAEYQAWTHTRSGPLFGSHADAKVLNVAAQWGNPAECPILDIGAGTGRNSLALAQQGFPVDALELSPALVEKLIQSRNSAQLSLNVIEGDILNSQLELPHQNYKLIFLSEVIASHFRSLEQVRQLFLRLEPLLEPGGLLLFNAFLATDGYQPSAAVRELAQAFWSCVFTPSEMDRAMTDIPFIPVSVEPVAAYEKAHLPAEAWPPTDWFLGWATGRNLFPTIEPPPIELRWLLFRKAAG